MAIAGVQASCGLRYVIMLRPRLQVSRICCAGVRNPIIYSTLCLLRACACTAARYQSYSGSDASELECTFTFYTDCHFELE